MIKKFKLKNGVFIEDKKELTESLKIENFNNVDKVSILLKQHIGKISQEIVKVGDVVKKGDKIAEGDVNHHSPISGIVESIDEVNHTIYGETKAIKIKNDYKETESDEYKNNEKAFLDVSKERLLELIKEKGIVGLGGAAFPTYKKFTLNNNKVKTFIVNGAECEPYLNVDNRIMQENTDYIFNGIEIINKILEPENIIIGVEKNKSESLIKLKENLSKSKLKDKISIVELDTKYPQGGEKQIIQTLCKKDVPSGKLPISIGIVVSNVSTVSAVYEAVYYGKPLIEKEITVSGEGIINKKNMRVKIGTSINDILNYTDIDLNTTKKLILGGPMMGFVLENKYDVVNKSLGGILALSESECKPYETKNCIFCGKCIYVCPMGLSPLEYEKCTDKKDWKRAKKYSIADCINCGSCAYICPSNRPLMKAIRDCKSKV